MGFQRTGRSALDWLDRPGNSPSAGLLRAAQDIARLQADIDAWAASSRLRLFAGPIKQGNLRLFSDHPAMLARARQQLPSLLAHLNARGWRLDKLDLKVRSSSVTPQQPVRPKQGKFGEKAGENWVALLGDLHDERLKAVTQRLCERNGWKKPD